MGTTEKWYTYIDNIVFTGLLCFLHNGKRVLSRSDLFSAAECSTGLQRAELSSMGVQSLCVSIRITTEARKDLGRIGLQWNWTVQSTCELNAATCCGHHTQQSLSANI